MIILPGFLFLIIENGMEIIIDSIVTVMPPENMISGERVFSSPVRIPIATE